MIADINTGTCNPIETLSGWGKRPGGRCVLLCSFPAKNSVLAFRSGREMSRDAVMEEGWS